MPLVTVAIPFYNNAATLPDAIRSVFAQTLTDWELLLVDDGSTDGSVEVARAVADGRVSVHGDGTNRGLVYRLNQIAALARGKYLARMDGDDLMLPERLSRQIAFLEANPEVDVVDCGIYTADENLRPRGKRGLCPLDTNPVSVLRNGLLIHPTVVGHTRWFRENPYDPSFPRAEDVELWNRTLPWTRFARVPEPMYVYREVPSLKAYLRAMRSLRRILWRYGPAVVGWAGTKSLVRRSYVKCALYAAGAAAGQLDRLIARRSEPLSSDDGRAGVACPPTHGRGRDDLSAPESGGGSTLQT